jgi:6-phosphogluconolactonase
VTVFQNLDDLSKAAADEFVCICRSAIADRGRFIVALSGGSTPKRLFALLASSPFRDLIEWDKLYALFGDERYVPPDDEQSNEKMARETLLSKVPVPEDHIFTMFVPGGPSAAAANYEERVRWLLGAELAIDLVLLGIGPDGHTASLFPGDPAVHEKTRLVVASVASANARDRVTMTPPLLTLARNVLFLIAGADKAAPLKRLVEGEINLDETPSQAIGRFAANVKIFADQAAWPS